MQQRGRRRNLMLLLLLLLLKELLLLLVVVLKEALVLVRMGLVMMQVVMGLGKMMMMLKQGGRGGTQQSGPSSRRTRGAAAGATGKPNTVRPSSDDDPSSVHKVVAAVRRSLLLLLLLRVERGKGRDGLDELVHDRGNAHCRVWPILFQQVCSRQEHHAPAATVRVLTAIRQRGRRVCSGAPRCSSRMFGGALCRCVGWVGRGLMTPSGYEPSLPRFRGKGTGVAIATLRSTLALRALLLLLLLQQLHSTLQYEYRKGATTYVEKKKCENRKWRGERREKRTLPASDAC